MLQHLWDKHDIQQAISINLFSKVMADRNETPNVCSCIMLHVTKDVVHKIQLLNTNNQSVHCFLCRHLELQIRLKTFIFSCSRSRRRVWLHVQGPNLQFGSCNLEHDRLLQQSIYIFIYLFYLFIYLIYFLQKIINFKISLFLRKN